MTQDSDANNFEKIIIQVDPELEDLIPGFLENRQKDIKSMLEAVKDGDYETIRRIGHIMKGAGAGYGFDAITEIGAELEQSAKDKNLEEIRKKIDELSLYLKRIEVRYE